MIEKILNDTISSISGAQAAIFLDGEGESIAHAGDLARDIKLAGAWNEIQLDHIKEITERLKMGNVKAVLFSLDEGNELIVPVSGEYCLLLFLSAYAGLQEAMRRIQATVESLRKEVE